MLPPKPTTGRHLQLYNITTTILILALNCTAIFTPWLVRQFKLLLPLNENTMTLPQFCSEQGSKASLIFVFLTVLIVTSSLLIAMIWYSPKYPVLRLIIDASLIIIAITSIMFVCSFGPTIDRINESSKFSNSEVFSFILLAIDAICSFVNTQAIQFLPIFKKGFIILSSQIGTNYELTLYPYLFESIAIILLFVAGWSVIINCLNRFSNIRK